MNNKDLNTLIVCSFRYALGRRTYVVSDVVSIIKRNWDDLTHPTKILIKGEIAEAKYRGNYGDECDLREWEKLL